MNKFSLLLPWNTGCRASYWLTSVEVLLKCRSAVWCINFWQKCEQVVPWIVLHVGEFERSWLIVVVVSSCHWIAGSPQNYLVLLPLLMLMNLPGSGWRSPASTPVPRRKANLTTSETACWRNPLLDCGENLQCLNFTAKWKSYPDLCLWVAMMRHSQTVLG